MAESGKVKGANNVKSFEQFVMRHNQYNDWHYYVSVNKKKLKRSLICEECGFGKSALIQNPLLKEKLKELEFDLEQKGILVTEPLQEVDFQYPDQALFIQSFQDKVTQFKLAVIKAEELIALYSEELEKIE